MSKFWCIHLEEAWNGVPLYKEKGIDRPLPNSIMGIEMNFCPQCGTPRPTELTQVEKLARKLYDAYPAHHAHMDVFKHLADTAIKFLKD